MLPAQPFPVLFGGIGGLSSVAAVVTDVTSTTDWTGIALVLGAVASILSAMAGLIIALKKKPDGMTPEELLEVLKARDEQHRRDP